MNPEMLKARTRRFALDVVRLYDTFPAHGAARIIGVQLLRAATSVAANYRAACRSKSHADFISKIGTVEEEADETLFWLEMLRVSGLIPERDLTALLREADELTAIMTASGRSAKRRTVSRPAGRIRQSAIRNPQSAILDPP